MAENKNHSLIVRPRSAVEKAAPGAKRILSGMVADTLALVHVEDAETIFKRGANYYYGTSVTQNYAEAVKWFRMAAAQGHARSQYYLGCCYAIGDGVQEDFVESAKWLHKAAEQGHVPAQCYLGIMYENGEGVEANLPEAVKWYRSVAETMTRTVSIDDEGCDTIEALVHLAHCYAQGRGTAKDLPEAYMWFKFHKEVCGGAHNADAEPRLKSLCEQMSQSELAEGENRYQKLFQQLPRDMFVET